MFKKFKNTFMQWMLKKVFVFLAEAYDEFGKPAVNDFIDEAVVRCDDMLEQKFGKEKASKIERQFLEMGEEYVVAMKKEITD